MRRRLLRKWIWIGARSCLQDCAGRCSTGHASGRLDDRCFGNASALSAKGQLSRCWMAEDAARHER